MDMDVVVGLRGAGKTFRLVEWLTEGHPIPGDPKWSRMIIAAAMDPKYYERQASPELVRRLWQVYPPGLRKLVISAKEFENARHYAGVEFAIDDAEHLLPDWVRMLASTGALAGLSINGRGASTIQRPGLPELEVAYEQGDNLFTNNKVLFRRNDSVRGRYPV